MALGSPLSAENGICHVVFGHCWLEQDIYGGILWLQTVIRHFAQAHSVPDLLVLSGMLIIICKIATFWQMLILCVWAA